jgi:hypothetical protein
VDHMPGMLDLAAGRFLPVPTGSAEEIARAIEKLGQGDLVYDSPKLILVRGANSPQAHPAPVAPFQTYDIEPPLPADLLVTTTEGRQYRITILAANDKSCAFKYFLISTDKGAGGGALVAPGKAGGILGFRIAPKVEEIGSELVEKYKQALTGGGRSPSSDFAWFEVRPGTTGAPYQITCAHNGTTYVLLWNDKSHMLRADGTWGLEEVRETTDGMGQPSVVLTFDATGVRLFHALGDANLRHSLAVVFEGRVISIPFITTTLSGPSLPIIGRFTAEEIKQMVATLRKVTAASTPGISGRVVDPDGKPVAGAQVALCTKDKGVSIFPPQLLSTSVTGKTSDIVKTDAEGRFSFPEAPAEFLIIAAHETGFARVDGADITGPLTIPLERWGRIEGTLYVGPQPSVDDVVYVRLDMQRSYEMAVRYEATAKTRSGGRFTFDPVVPGWLLIGRIAKMKGTSEAQTSSIEQPIHVKAGTALEVRVGGTGRPVIGRLVPPPDSNSPGDLNWDICTLETVSPTPPWPAGYDRMTGAEKRQWYQQWIKTPEGRAFEASSAHDLDRRSYFFSVDKNSAFRIDDVIPGRYEFWAGQREPSPSGRPTRLSGWYRARIEVPPMAQTYTSEPLDLGAVLLRRNQPPP